jgi:hypothetical protein
MVSSTERDFIKAKTVQNIEGSTLRMSEAVKA